MRVQGRHGHHTRIISAYRPCKNRETLGTTYRQQETYWTNNNEPRCPIKVFDEQLEALLDLWLTTGDHIILGLDANEDVRSGKIAAMTSKLGMHEAVLRMHRPSVPPETHNRNTHQIPIDGIFVTPGIQPTQGGYTSYGQCVASDHRSIWLDIPYTSILGHNLPDMHRRPTRRLQAKDPRLVDKYNKISKKAMAQSQQALPKEVQRLVTMCKEGASRIDIMIQHSHILKHSVRIRLEAARKTRHIYSGKWAWSPEWRKLERQVKLWRVAKQRFHRRIRGRYLRRLMKRAGNQDCFQLNEEQTILRHAEAHANLNAFKPKAEDFRNEHLKSLAKEIATRKRTSMKVELKKLTNQESMRRMGAN